MKLEIIKLVKKFNSTVAVNNISFKIAKNKKNYLLHINCTYTEFHFYIIYQIIF